MYLEVPSGLMELMYEGFNGRFGGRWVKAREGDWTLNVKIKEYTYRLHVVKTALEHRCGLRISKEGWAVTFDVEMMELMMGLDEKNKKTYCDMLTITATEKESGKKGRFFFIVDKEEEKIHKLNKKASE